MIARSCRRMPIALRLTTIASRPEAPDSYAMEPCCPGMKYRDGPQGLTIASSDNSLPSSQVGWRPIGYQCPGRAPGRDQHATRVARPILRNETLPLGRWPLTVKPRPLTCFIASLRPRLDAWHDGRKATLATQVEAAWMRPRPWRGDPPRCGAGPAARHARTGQSATASVP